MSQMQGNNHYTSGEGHEDDLERLLLEGVPLTSETEEARPSQATPLDEDEDQEIFPDHDVQGALGCFAEASQDMATAGLELGLGRHFACADFCNQAAEKAAQAVSLLRVGHRVMYDHDLRTLGERVGAPQEIQDEMARLTPFHPETFYADTPPEEADEIINAEQASSYMQSARKVLRWARGIVFSV
ncbi:MAG: HEPN domain-containing protein [Ktedonobacteraceae bacterium]|nr:HEPN domain-containing protein [Ktedonobacteraceae bacterium]